MQDRYAGDVGDFGKFSLLKFLFSREGYQLGVVWYLFPDESTNADGKHTDYVTKTPFLACDEHLCKKLSSIVSTERSVRSLAQGKLLKKDTVYFSEQLDFHLSHPTQSKADKTFRESHRENWLRRAVATMASCNVVFLDPDNGLEIDSCKKRSQLKAGKYTYYSEVTALARGKLVCVIYHHLNRHKNHGPHEFQIQYRTQELRRRVAPDGAIFALRYRPYSPRAYFLLTSKRAESTIRTKVKDFMRGPCGVHWDNYFEG